MFSYDGSLRQRNKWLCFLKNFQKKIEQVGRQCWSKNGNNNFRIGTRN